MRTGVSRLILRHEHEFARRSLNEALSSGFVSLDVRPLSTRESGLSVLASRLARVVVEMHILIGQGVGDDHALGDEGKPADDSEYDISQDPEGHAFE